MLENGEGQIDDDAGSPVGQLTSERLWAGIQDAHINFLIGAGTSSGLFNVLGGVETALAAVEEVTGYPGAKDLARASIQACFFKGVLAPNRALLDGAPSAGNLLDSYGAFARALNRIVLARRSTLVSRKVSIFTTNMDMACELAFERQRLELTDGFVGRIQPVYDPSVFGAVRQRTGLLFEQRSEAPTFDLYKLHGSVGWRAIEDAGRSGIGFDAGLDQLAVAAAALKEAEGYLLEIETAADLDAERLIARASAARPSATAASKLVAFTEAYERLLIINPERMTSATSVLNETYHELLRRFANGLERENSILLVHGFSFRDARLRTLVLRAARTNPTLQIIVFCFTPDDVSEYGRLMPEPDVPNGNILYVAPESEDTPTLTLDVIVRTWLGPMAPGPRRGLNSPVGGSPG